MWLISPLLIELLLLYCIQVSDSSSLLLDTEAFLQNGYKVWRYSKIMIVGEGRAGKTAFSNSIIGKEFANTESTIGINNFTCDVNFASLGKGAWDVYSKPTKELELAIAEGLALRDKKEDPSGDILSIMEQEHVNSSKDDKSIRQDSYEMSNVVAPVLRVLHGVVLKHHA